VQKRHACDHQNDPLQIEHHPRQECLCNVSGLPAVVDSPKVMARLGLAELGLYRLALAQPLLAMRNSELYHI
jgi:hypothetical protein